MKGWVYIITTKSMPDLVKIGFSTKDPQARATELNNTGNPHPYKVEYDILVNNPRQIEQHIHNVLKSRHLHENKEWFRCSIKVAIDVIREVAENKIILENISTKISLEPKNEAVENQKIEVRRLELEEERIQKATQLEKERIQRAKQAEEERRRIKFSFGLNVFGILIGFPVIVVFLFLSVNSLNFSVDEKFQRNNSNVLSAKIISTKSYHRKEGLTQKLFYKLEYEFTLPKNSEKYRNEVELSEEKYKDFKNLETLDVRYNKDNPKSNRLASIKDSDLLDILFLPIFLFTLASGTAYSFYIERKELSIMQMRGEKPPLEKPIWYSIKIE